MNPNLKITAKQIRFMFDSGKVWMIQPLHFDRGAPEDLRGFYSVPCDDLQAHGWGLLNSKKEEKILREWVSTGYKL